jgi:hypothetical protein
MPVSLPTRSILLVGMVALLFFVVGPQGGSLDDDGDGNPDIPVVVSDSVLVDAEATATYVDEYSPKIHDVLMAVHRGVRSPHIDPIKSPIQSIDEDSVFRSCGSLRC